MRSHSPSRRSFLRATAGAVGAGLLTVPAAARETTTDATATGTPANGTATGTETGTGTPSGGTDLAGWFSNTDGVSEIVDKRGQSEITVGVGAEGNGGSFAFAPAAVRVDPGTTVTWEWTGAGSHNVVAEDGSFESDLYSDAGATSTYTPSESGVVRYACTPHRAMGMKGALVAGDLPVSVGAEAETETRGRTFDGWLANADNYEEVVDERGNSEVTVDVGVAANGGSFGFGPAAVRVDPGTTVVWRWRGTGGTHNVSALDGSFRSPLASDRGREFAHTFDRERVVKYGCEPHAALGMRGVVVVGDGEPNGAFGGTDAGLVAGAAAGVTAFLSPLGLGLAMRLNGDDEPAPPERADLPTSDPERRE